MPIVEIKTKFRFLDPRYVFICDYCGLVHGRLRSSLTVLVRGWQGTRNDLKCRSCLELEWQKEKVHAYIHKGRALETPRFSGDGGSHN